MKNLKSFCASRWPWESRDHLFSRLLPFKNCETFVHRIRCIWCLIPTACINYNANLSQNRSMSHT